ncbi:hypothetical protein C7Y71_009840 [Pseudoprevotella muciniphila]|uniref:Lipoprotein n=1 Tax=Pseudoprevotella muciniphila TaxID=2133944 RepID=A0A5P8E8I9_9BACT|nr:hypothetical protein [Pseudoprevotella muciniphila]QFQ13283.1 hypothetical protein C7Y71_009840 [Pseudoprevotella muciniphila]
MKKLLPLLIAIFSLAGCKPDEIIITQTEVQRVTDTLHQYSVLRDSIYFRDSIFLYRETMPSVLPEGRDTVRETKFVYRYLYKEQKGKDSVRVINRTDTIRITEPDLKALEAAESEAKAEKATAAKWRIYFFLLIVAVIGFVIYFIYRKIKP